MVTWHKSRGLLDGFYNTEFLRLYVITQLNCLDDLVFSTFGVRIGRPFPYLSLRASIQMTLLGLLLLEYTRFPSIHCRQCFIKSNVITACLHRGNQQFHGLPHLIFAFVCFCWFVIARCVVFSQVPILEETKSGF